MNDIAPAVLEKIQGSPLEKERLDEQGREQRKKEKKKQTVEVRRISFDGIMGAEAVQLATSLSRVTIWREEMAGRFPARVQLTGSRIGWHGCEIQEWIAARPRIENGEAIE